MLCKVNQGADAIDPSCAAAMTQHQGDSTSSQIGSELGPTFAFNDFAVFCEPKISFERLDDWILGRASGDELYLFSWKHADL